ncbi:chondroitinase-B domain-containing protein [Formosa algae]|uniref:Poly(Beta-D-mannuronate) lyase n=1 Tax=Formosa algae TaxID=225843 RepID=A0A9X0YIW7_9FLAO|nr:chondroitinase-B domain-containing protein [Formosa algae]MBP1839925.1 poly(beta-D-mannuronate) lyase [Formosa algae]MDQ0335524.1 poly(beta-D-mannuronate) lyase [Formosa algae]OEI81774.1 alginate lyase [Formosa algae]
MNITKSTISILFLSILFTAQVSAQALKTVVKNAQELDLAIKSAKPGSHIVMANGVWTDVVIKFKGEGTKEQPIVLEAETPGQVFIEGQSTLRLGGDYLEVSGLYFRNGYTPKNTVIDFRTDEDNVANYSKVTNCVIDGFTQPDRDFKDHWVQLYGRHNELSNCFITGKSNPGPTIRVFLGGNESIYNHHRIVNNYFGERPRLGGPHGETLQIGDSYTSMTPSYTEVENNLFEKCNGEIEIISSKSNFNEFKNNIFFECEGSLVLRHGNYAKVDGNVFIGNDNSTAIGGVRVVNTGHWITNNYFYKIRGNEFRSAIAVMNGIPKSPLNRYNQVTDVVIAYNTFIDNITPLQFSVGTNVDKSDVLPASEIRSARPIRTVVANNLIYNEDASETTQVLGYNEVDGVTFKNNITNNKVEGDVDTNGGLTQQSIEMKKVSDWFYAPTKAFSDVYNGFEFETIDKDILGSDRTKNNAIGAVTFPYETGGIVNINKSEYGPSWYKAEVAKKSKTIKVTSAAALMTALGTANSGDVLEVKSGSYKISESLNIDKTITIKSSSKRQVKIEYTGAKGTALFLMLPKGNLVLDNVALKGNDTQDAFSTLEKNMSIAYNLKVTNSEISNFNNVLMSYKGSFADDIVFKNTEISDCANGIQLAGEDDDKGDYNAEYVTIENSIFENVDKNVLNYYRGGYDESTVGGTLVFKNNTVKESGSKEDSKILLQTRGIVNLDFSGNTFKDNPTPFVIVLWGEKGQESVNNTLENSGEVKTEQNLKMKLMY